MSLKLPISYDPMNYDRLHTTAEILEAFQTCRDAGEEIDLFEALAWRDEPPIEAFIEIVRKIKLEPVLALAIQALGWVKNVEVLERSKKSDDLLEILADLAKSGETDLIRWSAAKSIIVIKFDFIAVSQHLTEAPQNIIRVIESRHTNKNTVKDGISWIFWTYSDALRFCSVIYDLYPYAAKDLINYQGIRIIKSINFLFKEWLQNGSQENKSLTSPSQQASQEALIETNTTILHDQCAFDILVTNQLYCLFSQFPEVRRSAISFLYEKVNHLKYRPSPNLQYLIDEANKIANEIKTISAQDALFSEFYLDINRSSTNKVEKLIWGDFEANCKSASQAFDLTNEKLLSRKNQRMKELDGTSAKSRDKIVEIDTKIERFNSTLKNVDTQHLFKKVKTFLFAGIALFIISALFIVLSVFFQIQIFGILGLLSLPGMVVLISFSLFLLSSVPLASRQEKLIIAEIKKMDDQRIEIQRLNSNTNNQKVEIEKQISEGISKAEHLMIQLIQRAEERRDVRINSLARVVKLLEKSERLYEILDS